MLLLLACKNPEAEVEALGGTITVAESSANLMAGIAYAAELDSTILLMVFPNAAATCEDAGASIGTDPEWNPSDVQVAGACSLSVKAPFKGELILEEGSILDATISLGCAMDSGEWLWSDESGTEGYFYSGPWWQGSPETFSIELVGSKEEGYSLDLTMDTYSGQFIYDLEHMDPDPGSGAVAGVVEAEYCDQLIAGI